MPRITKEPAPIAELEPPAPPRADGAALIEALGGDEGLGGYTLAAGAEGHWAQARDPDVRIATHRSRPALRQRRDGAVVHEGRGELFAPTPAAALERMRLVGGIGEIGYTLVLAEDVAGPLALALDAAPAADIPGVLVAEGAVIERIHGRTFVTCRDPAVVARCLAFASAAGARVRFGDEVAVPAREADEPARLAVLAASGDARDGLRIRGGDSAGRFVQHRLASGELAEELVVEPGRVLRVPPRGGRAYSARVARWMARGRLAFLETSRDATVAADVTRTAAAMGWAFWRDLVAELAGLTALAEWGGVVNPRLGPASAGNDARGQARASARGPLLPLGIFPFRGGEVLVDASGALLGPPWPDAAALVPMASGARTLLEKVALEDALRGTPLGRAPFVRVEGIAGRDFWRRLPAARDDAASDAVSEHWVGEGVWVERGVGAAERPFVRLSVARDEELVVLAKRLARTAGDAIVAVDCAGPEGWARLERLRGAGLRATPAD